MKNSIESAKQEAREAILEVYPIASEIPEVQEDMYEFTLSTPTTRNAESHRRPQCTTQI